MELTWNPVLQIRPVQGRADVRKLRDHFSEWRASGRTVAYKKSRGRNGRDLGKLKQHERENLSRDISNVDCGDARTYSSVGLPAEVDCFVFPVDARRGQLVLNRRSQGRVRIDVNFLVRM